MCTSSNIFFYKVIVFLHWEQNMLLCSRLLLTWVEESNEPFLLKFVGCLSSLVLSLLFRYLSRFISFSRTTRKFQLNVAQNIIVWRGSKFVKMKGQTLLRVKTILNYWKYVCIFQISSCLKRFGKKSGGRMGQQCGIKYFT